MAVGPRFAHIYCMRHIHFPNVGYTATTISSQLLAQLQSHVDSIDLSLEGGIDHSHVGVVTHEHRIVDDLVRDSISSVLQQCVQEYVKNNHFPLEPRPLGLTDCWANFQNPGEYMIPHTHRGLFSFALWLRVPFTQAEEREWRESNGKPSTALHAFAFHYTDALGRITPYEIPVDREWEGTLVLFPCEMMHSVTPFYSTDQQRITVSGNVEYVG